LFILKDQTSLDYLFVVSCFPVSDPDFFGPTLKCFLQGTLKDSLKNEKAELASTILKYEGATQQVYKYVAYPWARRDCKSDILVIVTWMWVWCS